MPISMFVEPGKRITGVPAALSVESPRPQQLLLTDRFSRQTFLVDTGAQVTVIPASQLDREQPRRNASSSPRC